MTFSCFDTDTSGDISSNAAPNFADHLEMSVVSRVLPKPSKSALIPCMCESSHLTLQLFPRHRLAPG